MQNVVIEEPYEFIPPSYSNWWPSLIQLYLSRYLRKVYGITSVECRDVQLLTKTLEQGHGMLLAPNHCRLSDPLVLGILSRKINRHVHAMASWHLFKQDRLIHFMARRMGAFSSEHIIETVERFEEDFTDQTTVRGPWHVVIQVGEPIEASGRRERNASADPIMSGIRTGLTEMLTQLATESTLV